MVGQVKGIKINKVMKTQLILGDCIDKLKELESNSVDSIVTDPPYHLTSIVKRFGKEGSAPAQHGTDGAFSRASKGFMGKTWDGGDIAQRPDVWIECLRVLKPGGHMLAFSGSRTYHRMAVAIEDVGFEIRDQIMWIYGSGFPKSHNIGKAFDKRGGNNHLVSEVAEKLKEARESRGISKAEADKLFCDGTTNYQWFEGRKDGVRLPDDNSFDKICNEWGELKPYQDLIKSANREVVGKYEGDVGGLGGERLGDKGGDITIASTDEAKEWEGWGTALKPAHEPIVMARKPLIGTVANNVLEWGVGGINIDGCRIGEGTGETKAITQKGAKFKTWSDDPLETRWHEQGFNKSEGNSYEVKDLGRFPANIIFDEEAGKILDEQSGTTKSSKRGEHNNKPTEHTNTYTPPNAMYSSNNTHGDSGGASRFFYCPKSSKRDRNEGCDELENVVGDYHNIAAKRLKCDTCGKWAVSTDHCNCETPNWKQPETKNNHPTVKPTELMKYLIRLVTPKGGIVLDPFMGSGSTGKAAVLEGMEFIGIEREREYFEIAEQRINHVNKPKTYEKFFE